MPVVRMKQKLALCGLSGREGIFSLFKPAKENKFPVNTNISNPFLSPLFKSNANVTRLVSFGLSHVFRVFGFGDGPKIANPVVGSDAVNVVNVVGNDPIVYDPRNSMCGGSMAHNDSTFVAVSINRGESLFAGEPAVEHAAPHFCGSDFIVKHVWGGKIPDEQTSIGVVSDKLPDAINIHFEPQVADHLSVSYMMKEARYVR